MGFNMPENKWTREYGIYTDHGMQYGMRVDYVAPAEMTFERLQELRTWATTQTYTATQPIYYTLMPGYTHLNEWYFENESKLTKKESNFSKFIKAHPKSFGVNNG